MAAICPKCGVEAVNVWRDYRVRGCERVGVHYVHEDKTEHVVMKDAIEVNSFTRD